MSAPITIWLCMTFFNGQYTGLDGMFFSFERAHTAFRKLTVPPNGILEMRCYTVE